MAARHLLERGFRTFGYLGRSSDLGSRLQLAGFRSALKDVGCECSEMWVGRNYARTAENWREFQQQLGTWMDSWTLPIGVFAAHDLLARYLAELCRQRRLEIPYSVALVGSFNEAVVAVHSDPAISSVDFGFERIGYRAAALLDEMMDGAAPPEKPICLAPAELVARQSTNAFSVTEPMVAGALKFISANSHQDIDVVAVADHVITTRRTLARLFQKTLGRTVHEMITRIRLDRVKHELVELNTPIKTIARNCGFGDAIHLCKVFQRVEGISPSEYRAARTTHDLSLRPGQGHGSKMS
jgi:LacI family transcriptional regulator